MEDNQVMVISEQMARLRDNLSARLDGLETGIRHHTELENQRTAHLREDLGDIKALLQDHEARLRTNTEGVTQFKFFAGISSGGATLISLAALLRSLFLVKP